ncbi:excinuclease ABC subunit UvrC [Planctomycetota bacterium]|nr:excinuclease ABC subunit UvrC [Planctomycetota bacterium]
MNDSQSQLERKIHAAPSAPGCYLFKNEKGKVLYVGKAKDLRKRVPAYLRPDADGRRRIPFLMKKAVDVEFVVVSNEKEALILELNLIKRFRPRYNVSLNNDDRTFVSIRLDTRHDFPRATVVHKYKRDGAKYFGPYASASKLYAAMEVLKREFPLRLCSDHVLANRSRPCVYHEIGVCSAPCIKDYITKSDYDKLVKGFVKTIQGEDDSVIKKLKTHMDEAAEAQNFERAAEWRDRMIALQETTTRQRATIGHGQTAHRDVHGMFRQADRATIATLMYRDGKLENTATRQFTSLLPDDDLLEGFLTQYYEAARFIPSEIIVGVDMSSADTIEEWVSDKAQHAVKFVLPKRGDRAKLLEMAEINARHALKISHDVEDRNKQLLRELQEAAGLEKTPYRMECFDISHGGGKDTVASGVCFIDGQPSNKNYRKYKIKSHDRNDDFASMEEVLRRRLVRGMKEGNLPDLIVIDGGLGQINRVQEVFDELNVVGIDLISLAKGRNKKRPGWESNWQEEGEQTKERIFLPGQSEPIELDQRSPALFLLMHIRDEAHRFAIAFHRKQKQKSGIKSSLDSIPGVGPKKKKALIHNFVSPRGVKLATFEELRLVDGITDKLARVIFDHLTEERTSILKREAEKAAKAAQKEQS